MKNIAVIILAAGKGTRMKSPLPKVLHSIAGKSMIRYVTDAVTPLSPSEVITVVSPDMEGTVTQEEQLGTGHAVKQVESLRGFDGTVLILYADTPFIKTDTLRKMLDDRSDVVVLGFEPKNAGMYGRLLMDRGNLISIIEYKDADDKQKKIGLCNSGVMAVNGRILFSLLDNLNNHNAKGEYYLTDIVSIARKSGYKCGMVQCKEREVMGINSQEERADAERLKQEELRRSAMDRGVMMIAPETVFLQHDTEFSEGVIIHPNVVFGSNVKIGNNVEIKSFSHIEGAVIENGAVIGPFARVRPDTKIEENVKIGNFVEVKKSTVRKGAKISHLTYIGDSDIGENANIGAGTVTCNYDGYNKSTTKIGNGAFIGSNSSLVAPVEIGDGAIIGAGTIVTKNVESNSIAVNERKQKITEGGAERYRKNKWI